MTTGNDPTDAKIKSELYELALKTHHLYQRNEESRFQIEPNSKMIIEHFSEDPEMSFSQIMEKYQVSDYSGKYHKRFSEMVSTLISTRHIKRKIPMCQFGNAPKEYEGQYRPFLDKANFCATNSITLINGQSNCGKSFFISALLLSIAYQKEIIPEWKPNPDWRGNLLYISFENNWTEINKPVEVICRNNGITQNKNLKHEIYSMNLYGDKILDSDVILNIKENVTGSNIRLIVIDTLSSSMNIQNENDNSEFNKAIDVFRKLIASVDGVSMVLIHHIGKESKGGVYAGRGASSLSCAASCTVNISREINGTQNIEIAKIRTDGEEEIQHQYSYLATGGKWNAQSDEHKSKAKSTTTKPRLSMSDKKKLILDHIEKNPGSSQKQIAEGVQMSEPTVSLVLKEFGVNELKLITDGKTKTFYAL